MFFSGDTGLTPEYAEIRARFGAFDLVMLEIGAFHPAWGNIHLGPENALAAHALLGGGPLLPIHWGTFNLALHPWDEPVETLLRLAPKSGARLLLPRLGEAIEPAHDSRSRPGGAAWTRARPYRHRRRRAAQGNALAHRLRTRFVAARVNSFLLAGNSFHR